MGPTPVNDEAMVMAALWGLGPGKVKVSCVPRVGAESQGQEGSRGPRATGSERTSAKEGRTRELLRNPERGRAGIWDRIQPFYHSAPGETIQFFAMFIVLYLRIIVLLHTVWPEKLGLHKFDRDTVPIVKRSQCSGEIT